MELFKSLENRTKIFSDPFKHFEINEPLTQSAIDEISNAEIVDEPVKEVQKPIPVNINKKTKVAEKLEKKSQREEVTDESEPLKKKAKAEKPTEGKRGAAWNLMRSHQTRLKQSCGSRFAQSENMNHTL